MSSCCIHGVGSNGGMHRRGSGGVAARTVPQPDGRRAGYIAGGDHGPWPVLRNGTVAVSSIDERYVSCVTLDLRCSGDATGEATHRTATECLPMAGSAVQCAYSQRHVRKPWLRGPGPPARGRSPCVRKSRACPGCARCVRPRCVWRSPVVRRSPGCTDPARPARRPRARAGSGRRTFPAGLGWARPVRACPRPPRRSRPTPGRTARRHAGAAARTAHRPAASAGQEFGIAQGGQLGHAEPVGEVTPDGGGRPQRDPGLADAPPAPASPAAHRPAFSVRGQVLPYDRQSRSTRRESPHCVG